MTTLTTMELDREALATRLLDATVAALELFGVHLGARLGLYQLLATGDRLTADEVADAADVDPRYAREWLEQQAVAGLLAVSREEAATRRFHLPAAHREVLADPESRFHSAPFAMMVAGIGQAIEDVARAYRTGDGVPWARYGDDMRDGQAAVNRPLFETAVAGWLAAMPDVHERLHARGGSIADIGCGAGWSTIALARAVPGVVVHGSDTDRVALATARTNAAAAGVSDRVHLSVRDASDGPGSTTGRHDLVCFFESLHDLARPVAALAAARASLEAGGTVLVVDERVASTFTAPGDLVERMMYGWSITCCLPASRAEGPSAATGTVMRPAVLQEYAEAAGFASVTVLDVEDELFRLYRLDP